MKRTVIITAVILMLLLSACGLTTESMVTAQNPSHISFALQRTGERGFSLAAGMNAVIAEYCVPSYESSAVEVSRYGRRGVDAAMKSARSTLIVFIESIFDII